MQLKPHSFANSNPQTRNAGFTLVEILIALVINILLLLALTSLFSSAVNHYNKISNVNLLNQQLQAAMQVMVNDIRRAGYWGNAQNDVGTHTNNNPFQVAATDVTVTGSCILFSYDYNSDGSIPTITSASDDERYGFRLNSSILQARPRGATFDCAAAASAWENVSNPTIITITGLTFTLNSTTVPSGAVSNSLRIRSVDISLTGQLATDATVTKTLTQHVRLRNDKFVS